MTAPTLRLLIIEGNTAAGNAAMAAAGAGSNADQYADVVRRSVPDADIHVVHPADGAVVLPAGTALSDFDGAILGGSGLFVRAQGNAPEVQRQVDLVQTLFGAGVPMLGSCWGLQVAVVAAGGDVAPSPNGREVGICRAITLSDAGAAFPMFAGKPGTFDSLAIHYDEVTRLPSGAAVLAANAHSPIQAAAFTFGKGAFWGVQYHPEFSFPHMARLIRRYGADMVTQGIYPDLAAMDRETEAMLRLDIDVEARAADLGFGETVTDASMRCREIDNWLQFCRNEKSN